MSNGRTNFPMLPLSAIGVKLLDCEHWTPKPSPEGFPYIAIPDIRNGHIDLANVRLISKEDYQSWTKKTKPQAGDIIVTRRGRVGDTAVVPKGLECAIGQDLVILRSNETRVLQSFLRWALRGPLYEREVQKFLNVGAIFDSLNCSDIPKFEMPVPSIPEQSAISNVLDALDSKIELNHQMNRTLEAIGQAVFKRWFVDFEFPNEEGKPYKSSGGETVDSEIGSIPNRWRTGKLDQIADLLMGISPEGTSYNDANVGMPLLNGAADFQGSVIIPGKWTKTPIKICKKGSLLFCIRATIGNLVFADREYCLGRGVAALNPKDAAFTEFIYYVLQHSLKELASKASGSVILGLSKSDIEELPVTIPDNKTLTRFHEICSVLFGKVTNQSQNSLTLASIRDCLLPRLMSGKIRVPVPKEVVEA